MVGVAGLGMLNAPEEVCCGKLGTELALGKLRLGETGADSTKNKKYVSMYFIYHTALLCNVKTHKTFDRASFFI